MPFSAIRQTYNQFGFSAASFDFVYRSLNKLFGFQILKGMTVTVESLRASLSLTDEYKLREATEAELHTLSKSHPGLFAWHSLLLSNCGK